MTPVEGEQPPTSIEWARRRIKNLDGKGIDPFTKRQALQVLEEASEQADGRVESDPEGSTTDGGDQR